MNAFQTLALCVAWFISGFGACALYTMNRKGEK